MHYTLAIITKDPDNYQKEMLPFGEDEPEYWEFCDTTEDCKERYRTGTDLRVKLPDGSYISTWDDRIKVQITKDEYDRLSETSKSDDGFKMHISKQPLAFFDSFSFWPFIRQDYYKWDPSVVDGVVVEAPYTEIYPTFEEFAKENLIGEWDEEHQSYGYMRNPNAKWDGYSLCAIGDFSRWQYAKVKDAFVKVNAFNLYADKDMLLAEYEAAKKLIESKAKTPDDRAMLEKVYECGGTAEEYVRSHRISDVPFALLVDGHWAEMGDLGWFGTGNESDESDEAFIALFEKIMTDPKYQDYHIGFIDCHY